MFEVSGPQSSLTHSEFWQEYKALFDVCFWLNLRSLRQDMTSFAGVFTSTHCLLPAPPSCVMYHLPDTVSTTTPPWPKSLFNQYKEVVTQKELSSLQFLKHCFSDFFPLQDVLKKEIGSLEEFFKDIKTCHLPLNPALCIKGIDRDVSQFT